MLACCHIASPQPLVAPYSLPLVVPAGCCVPLLYNLLLPTLVGIDIDGTPDLGRGGAHTGGVASRQEEVHLRHTCAQSPPSGSRYRQRQPAFRRHRITIVHSLAVASLPRCRSPSPSPHASRAVTLLPPPQPPPCCHPAATVALCAAAPLCTAATTADAAAAALQASCRLRHAVALQPLPPPRRCRQAAANVTLSRWHHHRNLCAAATALPLSRCTLLPCCRCRCATAKLLPTLRCHTAATTAAICWLVVALLYAVRFRHRMPACNR